MLPHDQRDELAEVFRLLGDPNRLSIVLCCLDRPLNVGELATRLNVSPSLVSHHLRLLRATRLLKAGRRGRQVFYSLPDCHIREMLINLIDHVAEPAGTDLETTKKDDENEHASQCGEVRLR